MSQCQTRLSFYGEDRQTGWNSEGESEQTTGYTGAMSTPRHQFLRCTDTCSDLDKVKCRGYKEGKGQTNVCTNQGNKYTMGSHEQSVLSQGQESGFS